jgi:hypothetical protein
MRALALALVTFIVAGNAAAQSGSETVHRTLSKRAEIGFAPGAEEIPAVVRPQIRQLAAQLKAALRQAPGTVEIEAYALTPAARVIAIQRAADLRLALVNAGVPAERINVRVMRTGGSPDVVTIWLRRHRE